MQPFPERLQGYTRELSPSVFHRFLEPGNQMGKLNPLGGTDFTDTDMVKVATHTGDPRNGDLQVYKEGAIRVSQHPEFDGTDGLPASADRPVRGCKVALWGIPSRQGGSLFGGVTRSLGSPLSWHRISACPWHNGNEKPAGLSQNCRAKSGWVQRKTSSPCTSFATIRSESAICLWAIPLAHCLRPQPFGPDWEAPTSRAPCLLGERRSAPA